MQWQAYEKKKSGYDTHFGGPLTLEEAETEQFLNSLGFLKGDFFQKWGSKVFSCITIPAMLDHEKVVTDCYFAFIRRTFIAPVLIK